MHQRVCLLVSRDRISVSLSKKSLFSLCDLTHYYKLWYCCHCQGNTLILSWSRCRILDYMVHFSFPMQKTNPGRVWASGEGAEIVCCRWKSCAGHRGSESLQVTWIYEDYDFSFISATEENSFKCLSFPSFSFCTGKESKIWKKNCKKQRDLTKTR